ncbi:serine/threonine protein phosphatase PrpC [Virgibacillus halotolerans]|uniref:protein phosphatase 2C domain-containing protein n=1 Tax=Virgibacillus halotolerans TaxID=1071053 RepID=UPI001961A2F7|nr:protein phosphatase 2C domain-containing protein [Virgibacillus halotolerans]MBM7600077.1 serine/threonine protein phosphatase PrpC [Virgibacillus halotolerans]
MKVESVSVQGSNEWNEDALIINEKERIYGVADGATSLVPYRSNKGETGGRLASQIVKSFFEGINKSRSNTLEELLIQANNTLGQEMSNQGINRSLKDHLWTTGVALIRIGKTHIEYVQSGDCMIVAIYEDGSYRLLTRDQISFFDDQTKEKWSIAVDEGFDQYEEIRKKIEPLIRKNKENINTLQGYSVLDGSAEADLFFESGKINQMNLKQIIIFSDGLFMHEERGREKSIDTIETIVRQTFLVGINGYVDYLNALEQNDPDCLRFPRLKKSDDKSIMHIKI